MGCRHLVQVDRRLYPLQHLAQDILQGALIHVADGHAFAPQQRQSTMRACMACDIVAQVPMSLGHYSCLGDITCQPKSHLLLFGGKLYAFAQ